MQIPSSVGSVIGETAWYDDGRGCYRLQGGLVYLVSLRADTRRQMGEGFPSCARTSRKLSGHCKEKMDSRRRP